MQDRHKHWQFQHSFAILRKIDVASFDSVTGSYVYDPERTNHSWFVGNPKAATLTEVRVVIDPEEDEESDRTYFRVEGRLETDDEFMSHDEAAALAWDAFQQVARARIAKIVGRSIATDRIPYRHGHVQRAPKLAAQKSA